MKHQCQWGRGAVAIFGALMLAATVAAQTAPVAPKFVDSYRDTAPEAIAPLGAPFPMQNLARPTLPDQTFDIVDYGAVDGGKTANTQAIAKAIAEAKGAGGGTVNIPPGKWLTGPIRLENNINLHLQKGATLLFSQNRADYRPAVLSRHEGIECMMYSPFIYADGKTNIAITGEGVLDGQGDPWWSMPEQQGANLKLSQMAAQGVPVEKRIFDGTTPDGGLRPPFFQPMNCKNVLVEGVEFRFGAFWTITPCYCENVIIRKVKVTTWESAQRSAPNGDGIDPDSCKNVLIEYCDLDTGDDCIAIKAGKDQDGLRVAKPMENIVVRFVRGYRGHGGVVCGSETSGIIRNLFAHDCQFDGTDRGLRFKTGRGRGGGIENVWCQNIQMGTIAQAAFDLNMLYTGARLPMQPVGATTPFLRKMHFSNITCTDSKKVLLDIMGLPERPIEDISFDKVEIAGGGPVQLEDANGVHFTDVKLTTAKAPVVQALDCSAVEFRNTMAPAGMAGIATILGARTNAFGFFGTTNFGPKVPNSIQLGNGAKADSFKTE